MKNSNTNISDFKKKMNQSQILCPKNMKNVKGGSIDWWAVGEWVVNGVDDAIDGLLDYTGWGNDNP